MKMVGLKCQRILIVWIFSGERLAKFRVKWKWNTVRSQQFKTRSRAIDPESSKPHINIPGFIKGYSLCSHHDAYLKWCMFKVGSDQYVIPYMPFKFSVLPFGEITTASPYSSETCASLCRHTVRSIAFERDLFNVRRCPVAGSSAQGWKPLPPCSVLWGSPSTVCFIAVAAARTCISQLHRDGPQCSLGKWAFPASCFPMGTMRRCFLISKGWWEEKSILMWAGRGWEQQRKKLALFAGTAPAVAAGVPSYLLFWQISIYTSARGLKRVVERS